eukprot:jgi/Picre1/32674/NNA_008020.t1
MNAGAAVEEVVETFRDEIDHVMLELLEARIKTARQLEQDEETNDVVSVAQQLASGKQRFIDEIVNESVKPLEFIYEVEALLEKAVDQQRVLEEHISKEDQGDVKHQLQKAFDARSETIDNVQEIVSMARMVSNRSRIE